MQLMSYKHWLHISGAKWRHLLQYIIEFLVDVSQIDLETWNGIQKWDPMPADDKLWIDYPLSWHQAVFQQL